TGFIFGPGGRNFLSTVVDRARRGETLKVIGDAWGTPTYSRDLAVRLRELAELQLPGVFHVVNAGAGATFEQFTKFALKALGDTGARLETVKMASLKRPAPRPVNSRLDCLLSPAIGLAPLPSWQNALLNFIASQQPDKTAAPA
ncbi:MAG: sugar nucleotide-binding protein, partial [Acidobacteriota bacterium]